MLSAPSLIRPPSGADLRVAIPFGRGLLAAGKGNCYLYQDGQWTRIGSEDHYWSAVPIDGGALLTGAKGVYFIDRNARAQKIRDLSSSRAARAHLIDGKAFVFAGRDGVFQWSGTDLVDVAARFPWAVGSEIGSLQALSGGRLLVAGNRGVFIADGASITPVGPADWSESLKQLILDATLFGDTLLVSTYYGGVTAYSVSAGRELWTIEIDQFGGNLYSATRYADGLLIGSSSSVFVLPDPTRFVFAELPQGDIRFLHRTESAVLLGLTSGVFDAQTHERVLPESVLSLLEIAPGHRVEGRFGEIVFDGQRVSLGGRDVQAIEKVDDQTVAVMQPHGVAIVRRNGPPIRLAIPTVPNSIAVSAGQLRVGTASGVFVFAPDGTLTESYAQEHTRVFRLPGEVVAFDSTRAFYLGSRAVRSDMPFQEVIDVTEWRGEICVLASFENGAIWAGTVDRHNGEWRPLDIPVPPAASRLLGFGDELRVFAPGTVLHAYAPTRLAAPDLSAVRIGAAGTERAIHLSSEQETTDVQFPASRLHPWKNPTYSLRLNDEDPDVVQPGSTMKIPRLPWGRSAIKATAEWAGLRSAATFYVDRDRPWWARTPAMVVYAGLVVFLGYMGVRLRTRQLERRAQRLQEMVDERTAELRKAQKAREDFFSTLSHEIRNPLNGVVGLCEILQEAPTTAIAPRERMFVRTLRGCADQLRSILDDVLDFARIDRGDIQVNEEPFELLSAIEGAARATDADLSRCTLELPTDPVWVLGDAGKVRQIVTNLVSNALKYGVPPSAHIRASAEPEGRDLLHVSISVLNTGQTVPPEELERIFTGFVRGSDALQRRIAGSGIGLAVSRRMAQALGGNLSGTSADGRTEFKLQLSLSPASPPADVEEVEIVTATSRALAIEDEQYNRLVLGHVLGRMGYEVDWAPDGATAMERVRSGSYDLILTDYVLPDTNGVELARKMLAELPEPKPPIVAVTAYSTPDKMQQAREAGISGFVTKPISRKKLEAAILGVGPRARIRQVLDLEENEPCDFSALLRLPNGRQLLAQYAEELPEAWSSVVQALSTPDWPQHADTISRQVHAFRSRILAVRATIAGEQIALLENAVRDRQEDDVDRLKNVLGPLIIDITESARRRAVA